MKKIGVLILLFVTIWTFLGCVKTPEDPNGGDQTPAFSELYPQNDIYYQIFVRSFADSNGDGIGDLKGITENIDYFKELGITALWLLPIHPSPSYHGYDVIDYYAINPEYGTMEDFEELIAIASVQDIKIVIDLVINHTSDQHPWYVSAKNSLSSPYRDYYVWQNGNAFESFVGGMKDLNFKNPSVINEVKSMMDFYLEKGVHGFRIDAAKHLIESVNPTFDNAFLLLELNAHIKENYPTSFIVSEVFDYQYATTSEYFIGSDSVFNFYTAGEIWNKIGQSTSRHLFVSNILRAYERISAVNPDFVDSPFLTNHDLDRLASMPGFSSSVKKQRLAVNILLTLPGSPFIYYGEELAMKGYRDYSQDGKVVSGYGVAYDEYRRTPFLWGNPSIQTTWFPDHMNFDTPPLNEQRLDQNSMFIHYINLISIRKNEPALMYGNAILPFNQNSFQIQGYLRILEIEGYEQAILVLHNVTSDPQTVSIEGIRDIYGSSLIEGFGTYIVEIDFDRIGDYS